MCLEHFNLSLVPLLCAGQFLDLTALNDGHVGGHRAVGGSAPNVGGRRAVGGSAPRPQIVPQGGIRQLGDGLDWGG